MAKKSMIAKAKRTPKHKVQRLSPLLRVRPTAGVHAAVRAVPHLLPRACAPRRAARRHQVELVGTDEHLRSDRGHAHSRPERLARPAHRGRRPRVADQARDRPHPQGRRLHRRRHRGAGRLAPVLRLTLKYVDGKVPVVSGLKRISKPGLRVYARKTDIPRVLGGLGIVIVSTSQGIMTGQQARQAQLGGEVLAFVW